VNGSGDSSCVPSVLEFPRARVSLAVHVFQDPRRIRRPRAQRLRRAPVAFSSGRRAQVAYRPVHREPRCAAAVGLPYPT
jgi:hypothetical protein